MRARFAFDKNAVADMEVEITFKATLKDWRKVVDAIGDHGPWELRMLADGARQIVRTIDSTTSVGYSASHIYATQAEPDAPPAAAE